MVGKGFVCLFISSFMTFAVAGSSGLEQVSFLTNPVLRKEGRGEQEERRMESLRQEWF